MKRVASALVFVLAIGATTVGASAQEPAANPSAPQNSAIKDAHQNKPGAPAKGHNSFTKGQARKHIEKEGYSQVTGLAKDKDGLWQAMAMKDGKQVHVALDYQGNVVTQ